MRQSRIERCAIFLCKKTEENVISLLTYTAVYAIIIVSGGHEPTDKAVTANCDSCQQSQLLEK